MPFAFSFPFFFGGPLSANESTCWNGPSSPFETKLIAPFETYALEQLRQRFLFAVTTNHDPVKSARVVLQMAFETEIGAILTKQIATPAGFMDSNVCERRHYIDVDQDMGLQRYLIGPALNDLATTPNMPASYVDFLTRYLTADYPRYRMSAIAAILCVAKALQA